MKSVVLLLFVTLLAPSAFAEPDLGEPERSPIGGTPNPPAPPTGTPPAEEAPEVPRRDTGTYTCRMTSGHYDATCVHDSTGHTMRFDHESVVTYNSACRKIRSGTYRCQADFLEYTNDVEPGDVL